MSVSVAIELYQPDPALQGLLAQHADAASLITALFANAWPGLAADECSNLFNESVECSASGELILAFELGELDDEAVLHKAVRAVTAGFAAVEVFYEQVGETRNKWVVAGKNATRKVFEEALLAQSPADALRYALRSDNTKLFKAALPKKGWGEIRIGSASLLTHAWDKRRYDFAEMLLAQIGPGCGLDWSDPALLAGAIRTSGLERVTEFVSLGADPCCVDEDGNNALHLCALHNPTPALMRYFVKRGVAVNASNNEGLTPVMALMLSDTETGLKAIVEVLKEAGADLNVCCPQGGSLRWHAPHDAQLKACLVQYGVPFLRPQGAYEGGDALTIAIEHDDDEMFAQLLTPEHIASSSRVLGTAYSYGRHELFKQLLEHGASPNESFGGDSLFEFLVGEEQLELARCLIQYGVDVNGKPQDRARFSALHQAMTSGQDSLVQLYLDAGVDPSAALVCLACSGLAAVPAITLFNALIARGADVNACFEQDWRFDFGNLLGHCTPLHAALLKRDFTMIRRLLVRGANPNFEATAISFPLSYMLNQIGGRSDQTADWAIVKLLLEHGADPNYIRYSPCGHGRFQLWRENAVFLAVCLAGNPGVVETFLRHGAQPDQAFYYEFFDAAQPLRNPPTTVRQQIASYSGRVAQDADFAAVLELLERWSALIRLHSQLDTIAKLREAAR
jgi:ankyrin repeat protein